MRATTVLGIVLVVVGLVAMAYGGISYTTREKVLDIGPIEATKETRKTIALPPVLGGASIVAGIILLVAGTRRV